MTTLFAATPTLHALIDDGFAFLNPPITQERQTESEVHRAVIRSSIVDRLKLKEHRGIVVSTQMQILISLLWTGPFRWSELAPPEGGARYRVLGF
jgi:hypothetical protein